MVEVVDHQDQDHNHKLVYQVDQVVEDQDLLVQLVLVILLLQVPHKDFLEELDVIVMLQQVVVVEQQKQVLMHLLLHQVEVVLEHRMTLQDQLFHTLEVVVVEFGNLKLLELLVLVELVNLLL